MGGFAGSGEGANAGGAAVMEGAFAAAFFFDPPNSQENMRAPNGTPWKEIPLPSGAPAADGLAHA
jgi:hypothetical protein